MSSSPSSPTSRPGQTPDERVLLRRTVAVLIGRTGVLALSFLFGIAVARALAPTARGHFALIQSLNALTFVVANFAVTRALIHHVGKDLLSPREAARMGPAMGLLSGLAGAAVLGPVALFLRPTFLPGVSPIWILGAILLAIPLVVREYVSGPLIAVGRPTPVLLASGVQPFGAVAMLLPLLMIGIGGLAWVGASWAVGILLSTTIAVTISSVSLKGSPRFPKREDFGVLRFGLRTYPAYITRFLNLRVDQFLVAWLASATALGYYAIAVTVGELLLQIPVVMLWALSGTISSGNREEAGRMVMIFCRWSILVLLASALLIGVATPLAVPLLFGEEYRPAIGSLLLLLPGMVAHAPALLLGEYFIVQRAQPGKAAIIAAVSLVVGTMLNFPLTPRLGAVGASIASSSSYVVMLLAALALFRRDTGIAASAMFRIAPSDLRDMLQALRGILRARFPRSPVDEPYSATET